MTYLASDLDVEHGLLQQRFSHFTFAQVLFRVLDPARAMTS